MLAILAVQIRWNILLSLAVVVGDKIEVAVAVLVVIAQVFRGLLPVGDAVLKLP